MPDQEPRPEPCGYCGSRSGVPLYATYDLESKPHTICRCGDCGFGFLSPTPTDEEFARAYDDSYYGEHETKFPRPVEAVLDAFRAGRSRRVRKYVSAPARILDIGCGNGRFLKHLVDRGYEAFGTERPGKSAERAAGIRGIHLTTDTLTPDLFPARFFHAVSLWHVFEHLTRPRETLDIIDRILEPGGYLFLSMPNIESIQARVFKGAWLHLDPPKHLIFPGHRTLAAELAERGFEQVRCSFFSLEQNPFGIQQSLLNVVCHKREILFEALKGNRRYLQDVSRVSLFVQKSLCLLTYPLFGLLALVEAASGRGGTMEMVFRKRPRDD